MSDAKPRILIMTCSHGSGHRMVANTLASRYEKSGCEVLIFDIFNEYNRVMNVIMEKLYLLSYKPGIDKIYGYLYELTSQSVDRSLDSTFYRLFKDIVVNVIFGYKPDLIVNTYNHRTVAINKEEYFPEVPLVSVITEFTLPNFWVHESNDRYYVASDITKEKLIETGTDASKVVVSGIPVRSRFSKEPDREALIKKFNLDPDKKTLIIFAGTFGVLRKLNKICSGVDKIPGLQTIVVCGLNKKLYQRLKRKNFKNIQIMRYINDIEEIYAIGDFMVTKPGGTVLSEVVATRMPVILYDPVPGQELENAQIFADKSAGLIANTPEEVIDQIISLMQQPEQSRQMREALDHMYYGNSTDIIVEDSLELIKNNA